jgi:Tol biopolymer transport system component
VLTNLASVISFAVSPDRSHVAYLRASPLGIWVADPWAVSATSETDHEVSDGEHDFQGGGDWEPPVWSPDGERILYRSQDTISDAHQLRLVARDGTSRRTLTALVEETRDKVPMNSYGFSPSGAWIYYGVVDDDIADGHGRIHRERLDGSDHVVVNDDPVTDADAFQIRDADGVSPPRAIYTLW